MTKIFLQHLGTVFLRVVQVLKQKLPTTRPNPGNLSFAERVVKLSSFKHHSCVTITKSTSASISVQLVAVFSPDKRTSMCTPQNKEAPVTLVQALPVPHWRVRQNLTPVQTCLMLSKVIEWIVNLQTKSRVSGMCLQWVLVAAYCSL